jgi:D-alanine-D-alanine ligase
MTGEKVLILAGGISHERDISLKSARRVADALLEAGVQVEIRAPDHLLIDQLRTSPPDLVWSCLHGAVGEDGTIQDLLRLTGIPYIGSDGPSARLAWNKTSAKALAERHGVQTPRCVTLPKSSFRELNADSVLSLIGHELGFPLIVKPTRSGSALGVSKVSEPAGFARAMVDAFVYGDEVLVETFVAGTEVSVSVIETAQGPVALPVVEIVTESGRYGYEERYTPGEAEFHIPARLDSATLQKVSEAALTIHKALRLRHFSRIDFIVDEQRNPWFLEVNVTPGMTETSLLPQAILATNTSLAETYYDLVRLALRA